MAAAILLEVQSEQECIDRRGVGGRGGNSQALTSAPVSIVEQTPGSRLHYAAGAQGQCISEYSDFLK